MIRGEGACLVCRKPLVYLGYSEKMKCHFCGKEFDSNARCEEGHFVCDSCHMKQGVDSVIRYCSETKFTDPILILQEMMEDPYIHMHGPEHHIMVGAALLAAYANAGGEVDKEWALKEMRARGSRCPGGTCGFWGCCGAAVSVGIFFSIINKTTPLSGQKWGEGNQITALVLNELGAMGGPRCCKRNSFTAAKVAVNYVAEHYGVKMDLPEEIICTFSEENKQCKHRACPYFREQA